METQNQIQSHNFQWGPVQHDNLSTVIKWKTELMFCDYD